jgi:hypothetical protein
MLLQGKVTLIVVIVFTLSALMSVGVQRWAILPSFHLPEKEAFLILILSLFFPLRRYG